MGLDLKLSSRLSADLINRRASLCFATTQDIPYFGPSLRYVGNSLVLLAIAADEVSRSPQHPCVTDAVSKLSRTTGIAAVDRSAVPGEKTKRAEVLWLANASFRCYFKVRPTCAYRFFLADTPASSKIFVFAKRCWARLRMPSR